MARPDIYPVIHHLDPATTLAEIRLARDGGADGVFLISHDGRDDELLATAREARALFPDFRLGINLDSWEVTRAAQAALDAGLDMLWADDMGVTSRGLDARGAAMRDFAARHPQLRCFASVAFKYQPHEPDPVQAAVNALQAGFVPTTSGAGTGHAPEVQKIRDMGAAVPLAVASGITPSNVVDYASFVAHILVATGIARDEHHLDPDQLRALIANASAVPSPGHSPC